VGNDSLDHGHPSAAAVDGRKEGTVLQEAALDTRFHPCFSRAAVVRRLLAGSGRFGRVQPRFGHRRLPILFSRTEEAEVNLDPGRPVVHGTVLRRSVEKEGDFG